MPSPEELELVTDRMQGVDCALCEDGSPHRHGRPATSTSIDQPPPVKTDEVATWDLVLADLKTLGAGGRGARAPTWSAAVARAIEIGRERDVVGRARYGTPLQVHNGRDHLLDAIAEAADQLVYLRNELELVREQARTDLYARGVEVAHGAAQQGFVGLVLLLQARGPGRG